MTGRNEVRVASCDKWLPSYRWRTRHSRLIRAKPDHVMHALREVTPREIPIARALVVVRHLPARLSRKGGAVPGPDTPLIEALVGGDPAFLLEGSPGGDLVVGFVGKPWRLRQGWLDLPREKYVSFAAPKYIKGVMGFSVLTEGGATRLCTETRVFPTDEAAARRFRPYWAFVKLGSNMIRHALLAAAARQAEKEAQARR